MKYIPLPYITEASLSAIFDLISDGIWDWNANTGHVYRSRGWFTMLGYDPHSLENTVFTWESIIHADDYARVMEHFEAYTTGKIPQYCIQYRCKTANGSHIPVEDRGRIVEFNDDGTVARMIGAHRNLSAEKLLKQQSNHYNSFLQETIDAQTRELIEVNRQLSLKVKEAERLATTDSLTGLANRYHFDKTLSLECARASRFMEPLSMIAMDIDNLKPINDQFGHSAGDLSLIKVSEIIRNNVREIDLAVRWGGDEFMLLLPNTSLSQAKVLAEKLRLLVCDIVINQSVSVTSSFGIAQFSRNEDPERFTVRADDALYRAKKQGRNQVVITK